METLNRRIVQMDREVHELRLENDCLRISTTGVNPTATVIRQSSQPSSMKIAKPTEFRGSEKDSVDIDTFLLQCDLYFSGFPTVTETQKTAFVLSYCKGSAGKWAESFIQKNLTGRSPTYTELQTEMKGMWGVANKEEKAARELDALKQNASTVAEYVSAFRQKSSQTFGFSDYDLRRRFRTGLQQRVRDQLAHVSPIQKDTLEKMITRCLEIGQNLEELDAEKKARWAPRVNMPSASKPVSQGGDAMDVDANKQQGGARPQGQQGGKGFKCYRCGQEGHMARNCNNAPVQGSGSKPAIKAAEMEKKTPEKIEDFDARIARIVAETLAKAKQEKDF